jgi:hypothetical protein
MSRKLTKIDDWLIQQPNLPARVVAQIYTRMMWVTAVEYEQEKDPIRKHLRLLSIRDDYDLWCELPKALRDAMDPYWATWLDVLNTEEQRLANGH